MSGWTMFWLLLIVLAGGAMFMLLYLDEPTKRERERGEGPQHLGQLDEWDRPR